MILTRASFYPDGSCRLVENVQGEDHEFTWSSLRAWADDWFSEWRTGEWGEASEFIDTACDDDVRGAVDALVVLAEAAGGNEHSIAWVGAGPLEDLLSHSGHGLRVVDEVAEAARHHVALREALQCSNLPEDIATRLEELGVHVRPPARTLGG